MRLQWSRQESGGQKEQRGTASAEQWVALRAGPGGRKGRESGDPLQLLEKILY